MLRDPVQDRLRLSRDLGRTAPQALTYARSLGDGVGRGLDPGSIEPVAALWLLLVPTTASCDGHASRAHSYPWIDFKSPKASGDFLLGSLSLWGIVQRGQGMRRSYRLNPKEIEAIDDCRYDHLSYEDWHPARNELQAFARQVLGL